MKYKNTRTGAVLDSVSAISGEDWVEIPITPPIKKKRIISEPTPEETPKKKTRRKRVVKQ